VTIGRSSKANIQIDEESISRIHARVFLEGDDVCVHDMGSTNGTYVNDEAVEERALRDGDLLKIGRSVFKFLRGGNIENAYHEEIYRLTTTDGLTQVYNKRYFLETLEREFARSSRYKRDLALVLFDVDHFKRVNDSHGHLAGDAVLKGLAQLVQRHVRKQDVLARYGGEEFALLLPESNVAQSTATAEKIRTLVERHAFEAESKGIRVTLSLGVAGLRPDVERPDLLVREADEELYRAKRSGRNRTCVRAEGAGGGGGAGAGP
jgi:diguanylate cyclase (GGDEF)-like protein